MNQFEDTSQDIVKSRIRTTQLTVLQQYGFFGITLPVTVRVEGTEAATALNYSAPFFIANRPYQVVGVTERHEVAGSDMGAVTLMVKKVPSGTAPASGSDVLYGPINLKATANTNQSGSLSRVFGHLTLAAGDALALITTGTLTALQGVTVSIDLKAI